MHRHLATLAVAAVLVTGCLASATPGPSDATGSASSTASSHGRPVESPIPQSATEREIATLLERIRDSPSDASALLALGEAYLQRARETADPAHYERAAEALRRADALKPHDPSIAVAAGALELARHNFADALEIAERIDTLAPDLAAGDAIRVDALVELGRYDEAVVAAQRLIDLRPDAAAFARVSYLRELHGDIPGAREAMAAAVDAAGRGRPEHRGYLLVIAAHLATLDGDDAAADELLDEADFVYADYHATLAARGRQAIARGDLAAAEASFARAVELVPLPEYVVALGETHAVRGDEEGARASYDLARAEATLFEASGVAVDLELAVFEADHGDPARALELATSAYGERPTIFAADALAWALFRNGRIEEAKQRSTEASRLGTRLPLLRYHAGRIAHASGDDDEARRLLREALELDGGFSATGAADARMLLRQLGD